MLVDFDTLPDASRVWIYQSNRPFSPQEIEDLKQELDNFLTEWTAHGSHLKASYQIPYNRFLVIALDENEQAATGCSIDASVHFIRQMQEDYKVDLLDRMNVSFKQGEHIVYKPLKEFKKMVKDGAVGPNTIVFNNLVLTKEEYKYYWEVPMTESWHSRFLN